MTVILVTYASKHHATAEIAAAIREVLRLPCIFEVDLRPAEEVLTLAPYHAVVLGSAVYLGRWQPEAENFLRRFQTELADRPTWLFSSGPIGEGDPVALMKGWTFPDNLQAIAQRIHPREIALFHGRLDPAHLNLLERAMSRMVNSPTGDFRDWDKIKAWAESIAHAMAPQPTV